MTKFVYDFREGNKDQRMLLGGKGANLAEMTNLGINVPQGFIVTTEACTEYQQQQTLWEDLKKEIREHLTTLEGITGKKFGDQNDPLLVSVRSGAPISMPGMMDTILNLGLNDISTAAVAEKSGNPHWAYDSYRRFIQMFSDVAIGLDKEQFEKILAKKREEAGVHQDYELSAEDLKDVAEKYKALYLELKGEEFPQDPVQQLQLAIEAVFQSWNNERAILYRKMNEISDSLGTAVNVQQMVFGNMSETSGTGVAFTRNPATGENKIFGEYLINAQGEDVVAGIRTPQPITRLEQDLPDAYKKFIETAHLLEDHYADMQDMEFTIQDGELFLLQTRNGKRTAHAAVKVAVDLVHEGKISKETAITRVEPKSLDQLLHPQFSAESEKKATKLATGLAASPGAATGRISFSAEDAETRAKNGETVILVRNETSPEDLRGMVSADGILTARGGMTSHAAVVARGMGKCCVTGAHDLVIDYAKKTLTVGQTTLTTSDTISINGSTGAIYVGELQKEEPKLAGEFGEFMGWVNEIKRLSVRTNADTPHDAQQAIDFGAEGIGLCRTEHMFFAGNRIQAVREMILSMTVEQRQKALDKIRPMFEEDFYEMYKILGERPMTIRLLDPPLHEFVPHEEAEQRDLAKIMGISFEEVVTRVEHLKEANPMLGHRGLRLAITYPEIARTQARAIIQAALRAKNDGIQNLVPEIMIPLAVDKKELKYVCDQVRAEIELVFQEKGERIDYLLGTMIETPRAALTAGEIATTADFFSFGTNDLTQMTFGFSRDDAGNFLTEYIDKKIFEKDPFVSLDQVGVGRLVKLAVKEGRAANPKLHLGVCGEHGGDPATVKFMNKVGLDYVSCSPFRVPIARLAAAQAVVEQSK
ncbi:MAG: pyruvate, phosphate dikinase [Peptoniphilaceae bacterium]|nr:pyruvate, phosphate dikinase [Peptoniphilaceae bacterium]MDD7543823.1 pyruvate, phosphate dikinase [Peptoniphilaceae bacterium]MDY5766681.1 pyruvate, phosphate dikinase [Peptoniphilaceae bacterium]